MNSPQKIYKTILKFDKLVKFCKIWPHCEILSSLFSLLSQGAQQLKPISAQL